MTRHRLTLQEIVELEIATAVGPAADQVVAVRAKKAPTPIVRQAVEMRSTARCGSMPCLVVHSGPDRVAVVEWGRFLQHLSAYAELGTARDRRTGVEYDKISRIGRMQRVIAGMRRQRTKLELRTQALEASLESRRPAKAGATLEEQVARIEDANLRQACVALLSCWTSKQPGAATARNAAVREIYRAIEAMR